jgi:hypothetical protein
MDSSLRYKMSIAILVATVVVVALLWMMLEIWHTKSRMSFYRLILVACIVPQAIRYYFACLDVERKRCSSKK